MTWGCPAYRMLAQWRTHSARCEAESVALPGAESHGHTLLGSGLARYEPLAPSVCCTHSESRYGIAGTRTVRRSFYLVPDLRPRRTCQAAGAEIFPSGRLF